MRKEQKRHSGLSGRTKCPGLEQTRINTLQTAVLSYRLRHSSLGQTENPRRCPSSSAFVFLFFFSGLELCLQCAPAWSAAPWGPGQWRRRVQGPPPACCMSGSLLCSNLWRLHCRTETDFFWLNAENVLLIIVSHDQEETFYLLVKMTQWSKPNKHNRARALAYYNRPF